jgi:hypothetical protein
MTTKDTIRKHEKKMEKYSLRDREKIKAIERRLEESTSFTREDRERMVRLEEGQSHLAITMTNYIELASGEVGHPRCAARKTEQDTMRTDIDKLESSNMWLFRTVVGATILGAITMLWSHSTAIAKAVSNAFLMK